MWKLFQAGVIGLWLWGESRQNKPEYGLALLVGIASAAVLTQAFYVIADGYRWLMRAILRRGALGKQETGEDTGRIAPPTRRFLNLPNPLRTARKYLR
jgi:hypothetical protein